ncbi:MAG: hypothetical protein JKY53_10630 [Flavobacteriales bacterium]|nr:hypothetical protein [Flavobacteriales bacterium]
MKKLVLIIFFIPLLTMVTSSQELVRNGSFEQNTKSGSCGATALSCQKIHSTLQNTKQRVDSIRQSHNYIQRNLYTEILGTGLYLSLNLEYKIAGRSNYTLLYHIGLGPQDDIFASFYSKSFPTSFFIPSYIKYLYGSGKHKLEIGIGTVNIVNRLPSNYKLADVKEYYNGSEQPDYSVPLSALVIPIIGYRFVNSKNMFFGIAFTPIISSDRGLYKGYITFIPWGGIKFGYSFIKTRPK